MKILFLDIDGVLNTDASMFEGVHLLPDKVLLVKFILDQTKARLNVCSSWRAHYDKRTLTSILKMVGLGNHDIMHYTPQIATASRGKEIEECLKQYKDVETYCILDDTPDFTMEQTMSHLVHTDARHGLTWRDAYKAIEILN